MINVEYYTGVDERLPMPVVLPPVPQPVDLSGARVSTVRCEYVWRRTEKWIEFPWSARPPVA